MDFPLRPSNPLEFDDADWRLVEDFLQPALHAGDGLHATAHISPPQPIARGPQFGSSKSGSPGLHDSSLESTTSLLSTADEPAASHSPLRGFLAYAAQDPQWAAPGQAALSSTSEWATLGGNGQWDGPQVYPLGPIARTAAPTSTQLSMVELDALLPPVGVAQLPGPQPRAPLPGQAHWLLCPPQALPKRSPSTLCPSPVQHAQGAWEAEAVGNPTRQPRASPARATHLVNLMQPGFHSMDEEENDEAEERGSRPRGPTTQAPPSFCNSPASPQLSHFDLPARGLEAPASRPAHRAAPSRSSSSPTVLRLAAKQQQQQPAAPVGQRGQRAVAEAEAKEAEGSRRPRRAASLRVGWSALAAVGQHDEEEEEQPEGEGWGSGDDVDAQAWQGLGGSSWTGLISNGGSGGGGKKKHNPWTPDETEALIEGVRVVGIGKWAEIKRLPMPAVAGVLFNRSAVDLKDKWRNLSRLARLPKTALRNRLAKSGSDTPLELVLDVRVLLDSHKASHRQWR